MRALAGPAMLLVIVGGFGIHRLLSKPEGPPRGFLDLELAGADADHTGSCYSLSTVIVANMALSTAMLEWREAGEDAWTLSMDDVQDAGGGPRHVYLKFTFAQRGDQARLTHVEASGDQGTSVNSHIDAWLEAPNERRSTPVQRCEDPAATGYRFKRQRK